MADSETTEKDSKLHKLPPPPMRRPPAPGEDNDNGNGNGNGNKAVTRVATGAKDAPADLLGWLDERTAASTALEEALR